MKEMSAMEKKPVMETIPEEILAENEEYYKRYGTQERYTGEEVGFAFLNEFIRVYKGSTVDIIPDRERAKMVNSLGNYKDMSIYQKYREIYWHFLVLTSDREGAATDARYWFLKFKMAIADGDILKKDETDDFGVYSLWAGVEEITNNREKIEGIHGRYCRALYVCRRLEIVMEIIAKAVGIDDSPYRGSELFNTYLEETNKIIHANKDLPVKPINTKDFELDSDEEIMMYAGKWMNQKQQKDYAIQLASSVVNNPDVIYEIRSLLIEDV